MYEYNATVTRVIDGDTISADVDSGFYVHVHTTFRLLGVNCPEVHGETKAAGLEAAAYTRATLLGQTVRIRTAKSDSFGRWLAQVYLDSLDFNADLVARGLAVPYMVPKGCPVPEVAAEDASLRERAERAERVSAVYRQASLIPMWNRWSVRLGRFDPMTTWSTEVAALSALDAALGLDAVPAGEETPP